MSKRLLIKAENIVHSFGEQTVLDFDRFYLYEGEKVGLVGMNGAGKTTLLKILSGELEPTKGFVSRACEPFCFEQFGGSDTYYETDFSEAGKMGVSQKLWQENVSGGEDTRIRLAQLFSCPNAVAFLDEPTSNLDYEGVEMLKKRLKEIETLVMISHDRSVLNDICDRIVEISFGKLNCYSGNYDDYVIQKEEQFKAMQSEYENYQAEKKRLQRVYVQKKAKAKTIEKKPGNLTPSEAKAISLCGNRKPEDKARGIEKSTENVRRVSIQSESLSRTVLARLLLSERDMNKKAFELSGGERMKLSFAMLFVSDVNLLIFDEPTNYLDIPSVEALEKMLMEYEGTLLFTSHDKIFVDRIATDIYRIESGKIINIVRENPFR